LIEWRTEQQLTCASANDERREGFPEVPALPRHDGCTHPLLHDDEHVVPRAGPRRCRGTTEWREVGRVDREHLFWPRAIHRGDEACAVPTRELRVRVSREPHPADGGVDAGCQSHPRYAARDPVARGEVTLRQLR
jgi:hypothetical protein